MTNDELKEVLYKISIEFVKNNDTMMGGYTYDSLVSDVYMAAKRRHLIGDLQIFEANFIELGNSSWTEAVFQFSPNYLNRETDMLFQGMRDLKWKLILPDAINRLDNKELENDYKGISEEILDKLAISTVEIIYYKEESEITQAKFIESLKKHQN
jgi:hypothetical protein